MGAAGTTADAVTGAALADGADEPVLAVPVALFFGHPQSTSNAAIVAAVRTIIIAS